MLFETCGTIFAIGPHHGDSVMERLVRLRKFQRIPFRRNDDKRSAGLKEFSFVNAGLDFRVSGVAISDSFTGTNRV